MTTVNWDYGLEPPEVKDCECECHDEAEKPGDIRWIDGHCFNCDDEVEEPALD